MTDYKMTPELAKLLTEELLDECWHEFVLPNPLGGNTCIHCKKNINNINKSYRTFTIPADAHAVMLALEGKGLLDKFLLFSLNIWKFLISASAILYIRYEDINPVFYFWLHSNDERFCWLAAKFMEGRK